jgi:hypothetical protein
MFPAVENDFTSDHWAAAYHLTLARLAKAREVIRTASSHITISAQLWRLDRNLKAFVEALRLPVAHLRAGHTLTLQKETLEGLFGIAAQIETLYETARSRQLTNRTFTAGSLNSIRAIGAIILDLTEDLDLLTNPQVDIDFQRAREEYERGECVGLEAVDTWPSRSA